MIKKSHELATWIFAAYRSLREDGYDADEIMRQADFDFHALESSTEQIPKTTVSRIWHAIESATHNDAYCLRVLPHLSDPYVNALLTSLQASGSMQNALQIFLKYYRVVHPDITVTVSIDQSFKLHVNAIDLENTRCFQDVDITFCLIAKYASLLLSNEIHPTVLQLSRPEPKNKQDYLKHYQCPVIFEAKENYIEFPLALLNADIPGADPALSSYLEQYLSEQMKAPVGDELPIELDLRVQQVLVGLLPLGTPKLKRVAEALDMSERTLQRKLYESGLSFTTILTQTRIDLAKHHLSDRNSVAVQDIAVKLGFTESGNFIRFFKQHTGYTPSDFVNRITHQSRGAI